MRDAPAEREPARGARRFCVGLESAADPALAARWLRGERRAVALSGEWAGGGVLLSSHPLAVARADDDPFQLLEHAPLTVDPGPRSAASDDGPTPAVGGGWLGWWGFELAGNLESLPAAPPRPAPLPAFDLAFHDHLVRCDSAGRWWFEALWSPPRDRFLRERLQCWRTRLAGPVADARPFTAGPLRVPAPGISGHLASVAEAVRRIAEGELSQANVCMRVDGRMRGDLLDLWVAVNRELGPAFGAYVAGAGHAIASLSPELFLRRHGRDVESRPIKGTVSADADPSQLAGSEKDRSENVMIVDLMRNDLGRVCDYGTVRVAELCSPRPAAGVWHLVSTVTGRLRAHTGDAELLRATFPPGSVTGAPKLQALRVIHQVEPSAREVYCGAIGISSPISGLELSVAIRTFETREDRLWLGVGGGIVSDSVPTGELAEALLKARGITNAAGIEILDADDSGSPESELPVLRRDRPQPAAGVIETMRVSGGRPVHFAEHLTRLRMSRHRLGIDDVTDLESVILQAARELGVGALRVTVDRTGVAVSTRPLPTPRAMALTPVLLPGGLGDLKWADRTLIDALTTPTSTPLFCDLDDTVLEAGYAAVMIAAGGRLIAPPLDGRVLDSISRRHALRTAARAGLAPTIRAFTLDEARAADAVLLSSSLRGLHPGVLALGAPVGAAATLCARLAPGPGSGSA